MTAGECYNNPQEAAAEIKRLTASVAEYQKEQAADWCEINRLRELCKRQHEALKSINAANYAWATVEALAAYEEAMK
jgi:hypothetical protein